MVIWNSNACNAGRIRFLHHLSSRRRCLEVPFVLTQKCAGLSNVANKEEGQKVRIIDHLVELRARL